MQAGAIHEPSLRDANLWHLSSIVLQKVSTDWVGVLIPSMSEVMHLYVTGSGGSRVFQHGVPALLSQIVVPHGMDCLFVFRCAGYRLRRAAKTTTTTALDFVKARLATLLVSLQRCNQDREMRPF